MMRNYTKKVEMNKGSSSHRSTVKTVFTIVLSVFIAVQSFANPKLQQNLSVDYENATLLDVLNDIKSKSKFNFFYDVNEIEEHKKISVKAENLTLKDILKEIGRKANFDFAFNGEQVVLTSSKAINPVVANVEDQDRQVTGLVVDQDGNPLPGANVVVKGTNTGAQTDFDGNFSLQVPEDKNTLVVSYVGFKNVEVNVEGKSTIEIQLEPDAGQLDAVVVVGTRGKPRTSFDSPVAVDNFKTKDLQKTGKTTVDQQLMLRVPSYNATEQPVSDAAAHFSPADLRGLFPSRTLVLVNGKRKNASALVYSYVTPGRGEVGVDMKAIPSAALENVEVLRDGAAAQYGSDAIAGVINLRMKENVDPFINNSFSTTTRGDGEQYQLESGFGVDIGQDGYANFTLSHMDSKMTQRAGEITSLEDEAGYWGIPNSNYSLNDLDSFLDRNPSAGFVVGLPNMTITNFAYNLGFTLDEETETEIYSFGTLTDREGSAPQFARVPYWVPGFEAIYPGQDFFLAKMAPQIRDHTFSLGLRTTHNEWNFDLSSTLGKNRIDYYINDSFNQSFAGASPSNFYNGAHQFSHVVNNLDVNRTFYDAGLEALSVAFGVEHRTENFVTEEGEFASYGDGESPDAQGPRTGSESFGGFSPENASDDYRSNIGFYTDITADFTEDFLVSGALRYENYSDFGSNVSWKLSSRYKTLDDKLVLRGSLSSGFRAPSLHQVYYTATTTTLTENGVQQNGILDNGNPALRALGIPELDAETSFNLSAGLTYRFNKNNGITIDAYQIDVDDRIVLSGQVTETGDPNSPIDQTLSSVGVGSAGFFLNAIDTRTQGIDIVYSYNNIEIGRGFLGGSIAANFNRTEVQGTNFPAFIENNNLGDALFSREDVSRVETWRPREKIVATANYEIDKFTGTLSLMYYGDVTYRHPSNPMDDATYGGKTLTDLSFNYEFTDKINFTVGVNNLFDVFPDTFAEAYAGRGGAPQDRNLDFVGRFKYPWQTTQFGIDGTRVFSQLNISF